MARPRLDLGTFGKIRVTGADGRYRARCKFRDWDGYVRGIERYAETEAKAERALKAALALRQKAGPLALNARTSVADLIDEWLTELDDDDLSVGTRQQYRKIAEASVKPTVGALTLHDFDVATCDRVLHQIKTKHGYAVAKTSRTVLSGVLGLAVRRNALPANPMREARLKGPRRTESPRALTPTELDGLTDYLRTNQRALDLDLPDLVDFMTGTGARIGEVLAARASTLDLDAGTWLVDATVVRVKGAGLQLQPPKTTSSVRLLQLPTFVTALLERRQTEIRLRAPDGITFGSPTAKTLRDPSNCAGDLKEVLADTPWSWVTFHTFRRTVATRLDQAGQTPRQAADQLGHTKPSMTLDRYFGRKISNPEAARLLDR
jgi:integrase